MSVTVAGAFGYDPVSPPEGQNIVTTTRSHSNRTVVDAVEACDPSEILRAGGAGHKVKVIKVLNLYSYHGIGPVAATNNIHFIEMLLF